MKIAPKWGNWFTITFEKNKIKELVIPITKDISKRNPALTKNEINKKAQ